MSGNRFVTTTVEIEGREERTVEQIPMFADIPEIDARIISVADPVANHVGPKCLPKPPIIHGTRDRRRRV
jgi:hypothetical protein